MAGTVACLIWFASLIGWWKLWVLIEHPWPLYFGMAVSFVLGVRAAWRGRSKTNRIFGATAAFLSVALIVGLLVTSHYGGNRPTGPGVGDRFPSVALTDARDGRAVGLIPASGSFTFVVLFRGFW